MDILLSIVIPAYNAEKYIEKCLKSIVCSQVERLEVIVVNDGSKDRTEKIVKDLSLDSVKLISIENGGVSNARNIGIENARGEYITFFDADDYITSDYLDEVFSYIENSEFDVLQFNYYNEINGKKSKYSHVATNSSISGGIDTVLKYMRTKELYNSVWSKVYKRDLITGIKFDSSLRVSEDLKFNIESCVSARKILLSTFCGYVYLENCDSVTHQVLSNKHLDRYKVYDWLLSQYSDSFEIVCEVRKNIVRDAIDMQYAIDTTHSEIDNPRFLLNCISNNKQYIGVLDFKRRFLGRMYLVFPSITSCLSRFYYKTKRIKNRLH